MSRGWTAVLLLVGLVVAMADPAAAQGQGPFFRIDAKMEPTAQTISKDLGSTQLFVNVTVNPTTQNPFSGQFSIQLDVALEPQTYPQGWAVSVSGPANACGDGRCTWRTTPGKTEQFVVTVSNTVSDPDEPRVAPGLKIRSTPSFQGSPDNPLTAALIQQMQQSHEQTVKGAVDLKLDAAEKVTSFIKRYPWFVLAGAVGLFVLGVVLVRKRKGGLTLTTDAPVQEVLPGRGASFPIQITNEAGQKEALSLTTSDVPPGWSAILPVERIELGPNETTTIWLTLKAPPNAHPGEHVQVNFVATTGDGATAEALLESVVVERYGERAHGAPAAPAPPPEPAEPEPVPEPAPDPEPVAVAPVRRRAVARKR